MSYTLGAVKFINWNKDDYKLYLSTCKSNIRSNSFNYRVIQKWNSLPSNTDFTSLKRFHKFLTPVHPCLPCFHLKLFLENIWLRSIKILVYHNWVICKHSIVLLSSAIHLFLLCLVFGICSIVSFCLSVCLSVCLSIRLHVYFYQHN